MISYIASTIQSVKQPDQLVNVQNLDTDAGIPPIVATNHARNGIVSGVMLPGHNALMRVARAALASISEYQESTIDLPYATNCHNYVVKGPISISRGALLGTWLKSEAMMSAVTARKDEVNYSGVYHSIFTSDLFRTPFDIPLPHNEHYYRFLVDGETASGDEKSLIANGMLLEDIVVENLTIQACDQYSFYGNAPLTASPLEIHAILNYHNETPATELLWTHVEMATPEVKKARVPGASQYDDSIVNVAVAKTTIMPIPIIIMTSASGSFDPYSPELLESNSQLMVVPKPSWAPAVLPRPNNVDATRIAMGFSVGSAVGWKIPTDTVWVYSPVNALIALWNDILDDELIASQLAASCAVDGWPLGIMPLADQQVSFTVIGKQPVDPPIDLAGFELSSWAIDIAPVQAAIEFPIFWMR